MLNFKDEQKFLIEEDIDEEYFSEFDSLTVRESYCMACESPLKTYHSLICPECLSDGAELLSNLVHSYNEDISSHVFVDPDQFIDVDLVCEPEEEIFEEEDSGEMEDEEYYEEEFDDEDSSSGEEKENEEWINPSLNK